jgi:hypothetical protein
MERSGCLEMLFLGAIVFLCGPVIGGALIAIGSGILGAVDHADVTDWYTKGKAQIEPYTLPLQVCPDPDPYCPPHHWWSNDIISNFFANILDPLYEYGLKQGVPAWNYAMSNGLVRLMIPFVIGAVLTALIKRAIDKAWE